MKKIYKKATNILLFSFILVGYISCGPKADLLENQVLPEPEEGTGDNSNSFGDVPTENLEGQLQSGISLAIDFSPHKYQYQRSNSVDVFSGYFSVSNSDFQ